MSTEKNIVVDFVARTDDLQKWRMVLVEQGPWDHDLETELRRLQDRLYGCLDAAIDGQLAEKFPETMGAQIVIQLDCYNVPEFEVREFFNNFSKGVVLIEDYKEAIIASEFVKGIEFEINFEKD